MCHKLKHTENGSAMLKIVSGIRIEAEVRSAAGAGAGSNDIDIRLITTWKTLAANIDRFIKEGSKIFDSLKKQILKTISRACEALGQSSSIIDKSVLDAFLEHFGCTKSENKLGALLEV